MDKKTILIVEDEPIIALEIRETLIRLGYDVPQAISSGEEALAAVKLHKPHLLLMDIRLGGFQDGIETASKLESDYSIPVIFLSAYSDDAVVRRAAQARAYGFLVKPFDERSLRTTIEIALARANQDGNRLINSSQARFGTILDEVQEPILVCDPAGRLAYLNRRAGEFFALAAGAEGQAISRIVGKDPPWAMGESMAQAEAITDLSLGGISYRVSWTPLRSPELAFSGALLRIQAQGAEGRRPTIKP